MAAAVVLHHCFRIFAEWNWENPVVVKDVQLNPELGHDKDVWNPTNERCRKDLFPILTPCYPSQNSTYNVMTCTRDVMIKEFQRARDLTRKILDGSKVGGGTGVRCSNGRLSSKKYPSSHRISILFRSK